MKSIWIRDYKNFEVKSIKSNTECENLIIGGGIAGIMTAYFFMKNNINFKLVEADKLACGVSSKTTAQLSVAHDTKYQEIKKKHGKKVAYSYYKLQCEGLKILEEIVLNEKINCDFEKQDTILYATEEKGINELNKEIKVLKEIGAEIRVDSNNKLIKYKKGIVYPNQAIFNPVKYMSGIVDILLKNECELYEKSRVTKIKKEGDHYKVFVNNTQIKAKKIIMACHYPIMSPINFYFTKMYQSMSYAVAFKTKIRLEENYISVDEPYFYLRKYDETTIIIGGSDHFSGIDINFEECYKKLTDKIFELDKNAKILYKWSTEDCMPIDSLPFVGRYSRFHKNIFLITGFQKWGFTNAHIAAHNITNYILGKEKENPFTPERLSLIRDLKSTFRMVSHSLNGLLFSKVFMKRKEFNKIRIGSGSNLRYKGKNILVYRESEKDFIILKNKCTHMGCSIIWNDSEKNWQSKCHGSIFDIYGNVLEGPATRKLERLN